MNEMQLRSDADVLRGRLEKYFSPETSAPGYHGSSPSVGHCAAVAVIVYQSFGGQLTSAQVAGHSHWFNRIAIEGAELDVDLTGDQFGKPPIQVVRAGTLYRETRIRRPSELSEETLHRASALAQKAGLAMAARAIATLGSANQTEK